MHFPIPLRIPVLAALWVCAGVSRADEAAPPQQVIATQVINLGDRDLILEKVTPPAPVAPAPAPTEEEIQAGLDAFHERLANTEAALLSATVYDGTWTLLRCRMGEASGEPLTAWLNVNFNYFANRATLEHNGRKFRLVIGLGDVDTAREAAMLAQRGVAGQAPAIPAFPSAEPAVVWTYAYACHGGLGRRHSGGLW